MRLGVEPWLTEAAIPQIHFVGRKIRIHRLDRGLSQAELGKQIGVAFQQVAGRRTQRPDPCLGGFPARWSILR
jgi:hypothetical protein